MVEVEFHSTRCPRALAACWFILLFLLKSVRGDNPEFLVIGVSGGLQDGFPDHKKLDYHSGQADESKAIFLGRALVRGYKAYLDVMQEGWRQYTPEPAQPLINSNVFASGCNEHANEYWIYIVDARQVMMVLNNEPRFLSITPDTGMLELESEHTHVPVRDFMWNEIKRQGKTDQSKVAVPLVTAVWFNPESHVPSPPIRIREDGTEVTNFPKSLAIWANVSDADRTAMIDLECDTSCSDEAIAQAQQAEQRYWDGIRKAVRHAEQSRRIDNNHGPPYDCREKVRFGVGPETARVNYPFSKQEVTKRLTGIGCTVDYAAGEMVCSSNDLKTEL